MATEVTTANGTYPTYMVASKLSCRYNFPANKKELENITPLQFLSQYCVVSRNRNRWYQKAFNKITPPGSNLKPAKDVRSALYTIPLHGVTEKHVDKVLKIACVADDCKLKKEEFYALAALSERLLCAVLRPAMQRCTIESLDWRAWKSTLADVRISPNLTNLLEIITEKKMV